MGNDFLYMFMMFTMMNDKNRPIPMETMIASMNTVPAPVRFMINASAIQNVEADCLAEDDNLRTQVRKLLIDKKISGDELASSYPRVSSFVGPMPPQGPPSKVPGLSS